MKPDLIIRRGNKFVVDEKRILPYMRKHKDIIIACLSKACEELKTSPSLFSTNPEQRLKDLNSRIYELLTDLQVYKD